ncbi:MULTISPECIES: PIN domain-containing protein [Aminobacter]|uniref:Nucleic-acid-binding protein n=2 Tax=Aminobacter niigataensis TaxID=83265 RepID=A0ABR6L1R4_9HYPH|nr:MULTISPECIES: type II toxin-antitoxin system VapC family toxin [Aminobacter]AWC21912.1 putative nucleic acid-binding protein, contains PIN domain [Aminobacter sp. MSH1]MBB4650680.1 putative nucleic-acid-binding protein [Aminobacter niigataensis]CAI2932682.1 Putative nucleic acid-binding protein, contains PIN domain [Aminobacter niigataensis]
MTQVGIDTNILLRMVLNDDPDQQAKALAFGSGLSEETPGFISLIVLVEFSWALASRYRQTKDQTLTTIHRLLKVRTLAFEDFDAVVRALERAAAPQVDFADALIAEHNLQLGCSHTVTFDLSAAKSIPSMELLS